MFWISFNVRHFKFQASFLMETALEIESNIKLASPILYILSFDRCSSLYFKVVMAISKFEVRFNLVA